MSEVKIIALTEIDLTRIIKNAVAMGIRDYRDQSEKEVNLPPRQLAKEYPQYKESTYREWIRDGKIGRSDRKGRLTATRAEVEAYLYQRKLNY